MSKIPKTLIDIKAKIATKSGQLLEQHRAELLPREIKIMERFKLSYFRASNLTGILTFEVHEPGSKASGSKPMMGFIRENKQHLLHLTFMEVVVCEYQRSDFAKSLSGKIPTRSGVKVDTSFDNEYGGQLASAARSLLKARRFIPVASDKIKRFAESEFNAMDLAVVLMHENHVLEPDYLTKFIAANRQSMTMLLHRHTTRLVADKEKFDVMLHGRDKADLPSR